jgi:hypothetical protein
MCPGKGLIEESFTTILIFSAYWPLLLMGGTYKEVALTEHGYINHHRLYVYCWVYMGFPFCAFDPSHTQNTN